MSLLIDGVEALRTLVEESSRKTGGLRLWRQAKANASKTDREQTG
jgi:hypothetical protein